MTLAAQALRALVLTYRYTLSGLMGRSCRFLPTCSEYALEALERHGARRGGWLTLRRLARCHPWGESGLDPVPEGADPGRAAACHRCAGPTAGAMAAPAPRTRPH